MLASLVSRQQALIFGHSVPMPVVVRTRDYGSAKSYSELGDVGGVNGDSSKALEDLFGPS